MSSNESKLFYFYFRKMVPVNLRVVLLLVISVAFFGEIISITSGRHLRILAFIKKRARCAKIKVCEE